MSPELTGLMDQVKALRIAYNEHCASAAERCPICGALVLRILEHAEAKEDAEHAALALHLR